MTLSTGDTRPGQRSRNASASLYAWLLVFSASLVKASADVVGSVLGSTPSLLEPEMHQDHQSRMLTGRGTCPSTLWCHHNTDCVQGNADYSDFTDVHGTQFAFLKNLTNKDGYHCDCPQGLLGFDCSREYDNCVDNGSTVVRCFHGGSCLPGVSDISNLETYAEPFCDCSAAQHRNQKYTGQYCEIAVTSDMKCSTAAANPNAFCVHGTCKADGTCDCSDTGYTGDHCEIQVPGAAGSGGSDNSGGDAASCPLTCYNGGQCMAGDSTDLAEQNKDIGGNTFAFARDKTSSEYHCSCPDGWTGIDCSIPFETCPYKTGDGTSLEVRCYHGSVCESEADTFDTLLKDGLPFCNCQSASKLSSGGQAYTGRYCEMAVGDENYCDDGASDFFCVNNGQCNSDYKTCTCPDGYTGKHCEIPPGSSTLLSAQTFSDSAYCDPEKTFYCLNLGLCSQLDSGEYTCTCIESFSGTHCEHHVAATIPDNAYCGDDTSGWYCLNNGICEMNSTLAATLPNNNDGYVCNCQAPFAGDHCETKTQEFADGAYCSTDKTWYCLNLGSCQTQEDGSFNCDCIDPFYGDHCEHKKSNTDTFSADAYCDSEQTWYCLNLGNCLGDGNTTAYSCSCIEPFFGDHCEHKSDTTQAAINSTLGTISKEAFCSDTDWYCLNLGTCEENSTSETGYVCACNDHFFGDHCEHKKQDYSDSAYCDTAQTWWCLNLGSCRFDQEATKFSCDCYDPFYGDHCEHKKDTAQFSEDAYCNSSHDWYCLNMGTCKESSGAPSGYTCDCLDVFTGDHCEHKQEALSDTSYCDDAHTFYCLNMGSCTGDSPNFACSCGEGFEGTHCEIKKQQYSDSAYCDLDTKSWWCLNLGTCDGDAATGYSCNCVDSFYGDHCEHRHNAGEANGVSCGGSSDWYCFNLGTCWNDGTNYGCNCLSDFTGDHCEIRKHHAAPAATQLQECTEADNWMCYNLGTCWKNGTQLGCNCIENFSGDHCEHLNAKDCPMSCANGGTCLKGQASFSNSLDLNGNTFSFLEETNVNGYYCQCPAGFTGVDCSRPVNTCQLPSDKGAVEVGCFNGGVCLNGDYNDLVSTNMPFCKCDNSEFGGKQYTGRYCEMEVTDQDFCDKSSDKRDYFCLNGGECWRTGDMYGCNCPPGFAGPQCQYEGKNRDRPFSPIHSSESCVGNSKCNTNGSNGGDLAIGIASAAICLGVFLIFVFNKRLNDSAETERVKAKEAALEQDPDEVTARRVTRSRASSYDSADSVLSSDQEKEHSGLDAEQSPPSEPQRYSLKSVDDDYVLDAEDEQQLQAAIYGGSSMSDLKSNSDRGAFIGQVDEEGDDDDDSYPTGRRNVV